MQWKHLHQALPVMATVKTTMSTVLHSSFPSNQQQALADPEGGGMGFGPNHFEKSHMEPSDKSNLCSTDIHSSVSPAILSSLTSTHTEAKNSEFETQAPHKGQEFKMWTCFPHHRSWFRSESAPDPPLVSMFLIVRTGQQPGNWNWRPYLVVLMAAETSTHSYCKLQKRLILLCIDTSD